MGLAGVQEMERIRQEVRVLKGLEAGEKGEVTQQCLTFCKYRKGLKGRSHRKRARAGNVSERLRSPVPSYYKRGGKP